MDYSQDNEDSLDKILGLISMSRRAQIPSAFNPGGYWSAMRRSKMQALDNGYGLSPFVGPVQRGFGGGVTGAVAFDDGDVSNLFKALGNKFRSKPRYPSDVQPGTVY